MYNVTKIRENELILGYSMDMYQIGMDDSFERVHLSHY